MTSSRTLISEYLQLLDATVPVVEEIVVGALETWRARMEKEIEAPKGPGQLTAGIGFYFWDTRPDVYDTQDIGVPEIIQP